MKFSKLYLAQPDDRQVLPETANAFRQDPGQLYVRVDEDVEVGDALVVYLAGVLHITSQKCQLELFARKSFFFLQTCALGPRLGTESPLF